MPFFAIAYVRLDSIRSASTKMLGGMETLVYHVKISLSALHSTRPAPLVSKCKRRTSTTGQSIQHFSLFQITTRHLFQDISIVFETTWSQVMQSKQRGRHVVTSESSPSPSVTFLSSFTTSSTISSFSIASHAFLITCTSFTRSAPFENRKKNHLQARLITSVPSPTFRTTQLNQTRWADPIQSRSSNPMQLFRSW